MKRIILNILLIVLVVLVSRCSLYEPLDENLLGEERVGYDPSVAEGVLLNAYKNIPTQLSFNDVMTDDAVNNTMTGYRRLATGEWNAQNAFTNRWGNYNQILYINKFLSIYDGVEWKRDDEIDYLMKSKLYGEAIGMRAVRHFYILQEHAGYSASGELLGVPYLTSFLEADDNFNIPRLSFQATVDSIEKDIEEALTYLPKQYTGIREEGPDRYKEVDASNYNYVFGVAGEGRVNGDILKAIQAKLYIMAASPAFYNGQQGYYQKAADLLAEIINDVGGIAGLVPDGTHSFYDFNIGKIEFPEILWGGVPGSGFTHIEKAHYPPTENGTGGLNPTQDIVDAFPMLDGYPIEGHPSYSITDPYNSRDPRLDRYILYNGNMLGNRFILIDPSNLNGVDVEPTKSTRSGYYLKKLLDPEVTISNNGNVSASEKVNVYIRYTDLFLLLAEAANEIGGPDYEVGGMSARSILAAIRARAGIGLNNGDAYLNDIASASDMRALVRNERRLELCFEGHRFYDLRRWKALQNVDMVSGVIPSGGDYTWVDDLETRVYTEDSNFAPIPYDETIKFDAIIQNKGW